MKFYLGVGLIVLGLVTMIVAQQIIEQWWKWHGPEGVMFGLGIFILGVLACRGTHKRHA